MRIINQENFDISMIDELRKSEKLHDEKLIEYVSEIINDVRLNGDSAIIKYEKMFDDVELTPDELEVDKEELSYALDNLDENFREAVEIAKRNIELFCTAQWPNDRFAINTNGMFLGLLFRPLKRVGIYIPGGRATYFSTILMAAIPASIAGVKEIIMVTPPNKNKKIDLKLLAVAQLVGVSRVFRIGGAQAIAALAYGTKAVPKVEKIVGPGNIYVTIAKMLVQRDVPIDMPAGPSEILIIADESANPKFVALDLIAQAEHDPNSVSILISTSQDLIRKTTKYIEKFYAESKKKSILKESLKNLIIIEAENIDSAIEISERIAPEHLEILTRSPRSVLQKINNAGAVFLGPYSPVALGDYLAGTNHILPTSGYAKVVGGLTVFDFLKTIQFVESTREQLFSVRRYIIKMAEEENFPEHANSIRRRFKDERYL